MLRLVPLFLVFPLLFAALACTAADDDDDAGGNGDDGAADATPTDDAAVNGADGDEAGDGAGEPTPTPEPTEPAEEPTPTVDPATRCTGEMPEGVTPGESNPLVIESGGGERTMLLYVPPGYEPGTPAPLVLNFHGAGGNASAQEQTSGFVQLAEREGILLATPDGTGDPPRWDFELPGGSSIVFVEDLLERLETDFCVDTGRVYSAGFSNGAFLSSALACVMPERITAISGVGGVYFPGDACDEMVPAIAFHGTDDEIVPFDGGRVEALGGIDYAGIRTALLGWSELGECNPIPYPSQVTEGVSVGGYDSCAGGGGLELVSIQGMGHAWPTPETHGISVAEMSWEFWERVAAQ